MISFSTQPGNVALDGTGRNSPFAAALLRHLGTPGDDLPSILINVRNDVMEATARKQVPWEHSALTAKFFFVPPKTSAEQVELAFWASVKDSTNPAVVSTYLERYPSGAYASIARALMEQYRQQQEAELAAREAELRRQDEARKRSDLERLESERKVTESRQQELSQALEELRLAREALKAAEQHRAAAAKAAEDARAVAAVESDKNVDRRKIAALPKLEHPQSQNSFDGTWEMVRLGRTCANKRYTPTLLIKDGIISGKLGGGGVRGSVSASGVFRLTHLATLGRPGDRHSYSGTLRANNGSGTFAHSGGGCSGTFTLTRR